MKNDQLFRFCRIHLQIFAGVVAIVCMSCGDANAMARTPRFYQMIQTLTLAPHLDRQTVERTIGVRLLPMPPPTGVSTYSRRYQGRGVTFGDVTIGVVDYYDTPTYVNDVGAKVTMTVDAGCVTEADIRAHYEQLEKLLIIPGGSALVQKGTWVTLTFDFFDPPNDCLTDVTVERKAQSSR